MHISKDKLTWIQLDITARCQAMCLECSRNIDGKELNPKIGSADSWDMPVELFKKAVTPEMLENSLKKIMFNGNFGDPCIHPNFIEILEYVNEHSNGKCEMAISTNGAMFKPDYWSAIGKVLNKKSSPNSRIIFGIDGLQDTHHIYRRNTKYEDVIANATAFINEGGNADWQYIIFDHNKHQVEEAKQVAKELRFNDIYFKGEVNDDGGARNYTKAVGKNEIDYGAKTKKNPEVSVSVKSRSGFVKAKEHVTKKLNEAKSLQKESLPFLDTAKITCQWFEAKGMYIEYDGTVWMCCWMGDMHKSKDPDTTKEYQFLANKFGHNFNNLNNYSFDDILSHEYFADYLDKSFKSTRNDPNTPRSHTCAKTCVWGKTFI